jgi:hypothetical protein
MRMPLDRFLRLAVGPVQQAARTISKAMQAGGAIARFGVHEGATS